MNHIPLFPLPVVLFPGAAMPLHIFEARYRLMVDRCLEGDRRFGLIYHDADEQGPFMNEVGQVGCVAEIREHQPLPDGRCLVMVHGIHRFRIHEGLDDSPEPFYEARIAPYDDLVIAKSGAIVAVRRHTLGLLHEVLGSMQQPPDEVPTFDVDTDLSFQLAPLVQVDGPWHQSLLELQDEVYRLERLDAVFQAAIGQAGSGEEGVA